MIAVLKDRKGFMKSVDIKWPQPEIRYPIWKQHQFRPDEDIPLTRNVSTYIAFIRRTEIAPDIWEYEEL